MRPLSIVTGASRGLGTAVAHALAARGHAVVFTGREASVVEAHAAAARADGHDAVALALDVTNGESVAALRAFVGARPIEILVNNAGIAMKGFDAEVARRTLDTNYRGALRVTDALAPSLAPGARVVMVSSRMGQVSCLSRALASRFTDPALDRPGLESLVQSFVDDVAAGVHAERGWPTSAYSVSKAAMNALTRILARELPGARVNAVCPGWVRTDMGGRSAPRSLDAGAASILWATTVPLAGPTGGFFSDGAHVDW